jgi:hypothetical protein
MSSADAADGDRSRDASELLDWSARSDVRPALRYVFRAAYPNDVATFFLAEALAQFQRKKLLAISFWLLANRAHRLRTRNKCAAKCWGLTGGEGKAEVGR